MTVLEHDASTALEISPLARSIIDVADGLAALREKVSSEYGISDNELRAAVRIATEPECTPSVISRKLRLSTAAVTAIVDHLVDRGLAVRKPKPNDRRSTLLELTARGRHLVDDELGVLDASLRAIGNGSRSDGQIADVLARIAEHIDPSK
jgi:DNA-binding MarR family transcriptional regulator